ncbi:MAG: YolD-like family protein [Halanaerobiales bacterium]
MTIKDRGNIKWTSLMLVEHRYKLKKLKKNDENEKMPCLCEEEKQRLNYLFNKCLTENKKVKLVYYKNKSLKKVEGFFTKYNLERKEIIFKKDLEGGLLRISPDNIVDIKIF